MFPKKFFEHTAEILNQTAETGNKPIELRVVQLIPLPKPGKPKGPVKNIRPIILFSMLRKHLVIITISRTFEIIRKEIQIFQASYSPGRSTIKLVFTYKTLIEQAVRADHFAIIRAFDTKKWYTS